jgi:hypothetical protein
LAAAAVALLAACSSGEYASGPVSTRSSRLPETTLRGVVGDYSTSARVIILVQPVKGVSAVVVSLDTEVVRSSGAEAGVGDLAPRTRVEVAGRLSNPGTLLARRIILL